jgi:hypothetical protein
MRITETADGWIVAERGAPQDYDLLLYAGFAPHPDGSLRMVLPASVSPVEQLRALRLATELLDAAGRDYVVDFDTGLPSSGSIVAGSTADTDEPDQGLLPALRAAFEEVLALAVTESRTVAAISPAGRVRLAELMARHTVAFLPPEEVPGLVAVLEELQVPEIIRRLPPPAPTGAAQPPSRPGRRR